MFRKPFWTKISHLTVQFDGEKRQIHTKPTFHVEQFVLAVVFHVKQKRSKMAKNTPKHPILGTFCPIFPLENPMKNNFSFLCKKSLARSSYSQKQTGMDQTKFKEHIIPLQSLMQLLAERMLGDVADAEDVVQDVFVALWSRRDELDRVLREFTNHFNSIAL